MQESCRANRVGYEVKTNSSESELQVIRLKHEGGERVTFMSAALQVLASLSFEFLLCDAFLIRSELFVLQLSFTSCPAANTQTQTAAEEEMFASGARTGEPLLPSVT